MLILNWYIYNSILTLSSSLYLMTTLLQEEYMHAHSKQKVTTAESLAADNVANKSSFWQ